MGNFPTRWRTSTLGFTFRNGWIGRDGPTPWPPRSPDITPLDFCLWGYVKDKVFSTPVPDITNWKARITDAFVTVTEDMLERTRGEKLIVDWTFCVQQKEHMLKCTDVL